MVASKFENGEEHEQMLSWGVLEVDVDAQLSLFCQPSQWFCELHLPFNKTPSAQNREGAVARNEGG